MTKVTKTVARFLSHIFGDRKESSSSATSSSVLSGTWRLEMTPHFSGFLKTVSTGQRAKLECFGMTRNAEGCSKCSARQEQEKEPVPPLTRTSKPHHLVLFTENDHLPSQVALNNLESALDGTNYRCYTAVLERQYHKAVCISYSINEFPTLLVLDHQANVLRRETQVRKMHEEHLRALMQVIDFHRANGR